MCTAIKPLSWFFDDFCPLYFSIMIQPMLFAHHNLALSFLKHSTTLSPTFTHQASVYTWLSILHKLDKLHKHSTKHHYRTTINCLTGGPMSCLTLNQGSGPLVSSLDCLHSIHQNYGPCEGCKCFTMMHRWPGTFWLTGCSSLELHVNFPCTPQCTNHLDFHYNGF